MKQTDIELNITTFILSCPRRFARGNTKISAAKKSKQFQMFSVRFIGDIGGQDRDCLFFLQTFGERYNGNYHQQKGKYCQLMETNTRKLPLQILLFGKGVALLVYLELPWREDAKAPVRSSQP